MGTQAMSTTGARLALATAALLVGGAVVGTPSSADPTEPVAHEISCGGYAEDGELLRPAATNVTHVAVQDGHLAVPATCGGYTEDGDFIGDD